MALFAIVARIDIMQRTLFAMHTQGLKMKGCTFWPPNTVVNVLQGFSTGRLRTYRPLSQR